MAEPLKQGGSFPEDADEAQRAAAEYHKNKPTENRNHGMEREPEKTSLGEDIRARLDRPHKGDVGRPGTNEDVFQGSKEKQLND